MLVDTNCVFRRMVLSLQHGPKRIIKMTQMKVTARKATALSWKKKESMP
jgi:hypothetical protein